MHKLRRTSFELGLMGAYFPVKKIYNLEINFAPQQKNTCVLQRTLASFKKYQTTWR